MGTESKTAVIIGAGPAGLTAAYELLTRTDIVPIVVEATGMIGGIALTCEYKGNRIDLGGHRFFTKSDRVMEWWLNVMPVAEGEAAGTGDMLMLVRERLSRIFFLKKFFDYPVKLNAATINNLGLFRLARIGLDFLRARVHPVAEEKSLEDFFVNRFGRELYLTFFKDYTEKVWGVPCDKISPDWGAQRVKGLSMLSIIAHAALALLPLGGRLRRKNVETSLIERFLYPKYGPGQMWEAVAALIEAKGGRILRNHTVTAIKTSGGRACQVLCRDAVSGENRTFPCDAVFSSMPVKDLAACLDDVPGPAAAAAAGLVYRDFLTVGLLMKELKIKGRSRKDAPAGLIPDNWIYVQEREVKVGRLQIFNNWSPYLVQDPSKVWLGLEYFCREGDELWNMPDDELKAFAAGELDSIGLIDKGNVLDGVVLRMPKAYPAYFGTYYRFGEIRAFTDKIENLFLIGRNGMHRYNNQDHSMLTAMIAVDNLAAGLTAKDNIWDVNADEDYHEESCGPDFARK